MRSETLLSALRQSGFENLTFDTPWSARLFGMTLAASKKELFTLQQFLKAWKHFARASNYSFLELSARIADTISKSVQN